jgi:type VI secretion system protein ImpH
MAASRRIPYTSLIARLAAAPGRFRFLQAVRLIERHQVRRSRRGVADGAAAVGEEADPRQRALRFRAGMRLAFPANEIESVEEDPSAPPTISVTFIGLTGASGVLPQHYSAALWREFRNRNSALRDFFDLFNDRLIGFFYRAWAKYRIPIAIERGAIGGLDGASEAMRALIGLGTEHLSGRAGVPEHALLHYSGLLSHFPRNAVSLEHLLSDYFRLPIRVVPFDGRWLSLPKDQCSRISANDRDPGHFCRLSVDAVVGESYWDVESSFTVEIGPIDYVAFTSLMPNGTALQRLANLARLYINPELAIRVELCLRREEVPLPQLGVRSSALPLLGWNIWLRHDPMSRDPRDAAYRL